MEIIQIQGHYYQPKYDTHKDKYYDESPIQKYQRNGPIYTCRCKTNSQFRTFSEYKNHIKTKTHKDFLKNYKNHNRELLSANERIKELTIENEFLIRKNIDLQRQLDIVDDI